MMKRKLLSTCAVASLTLVVGCPVPPAPAPESVLEGSWTITPADPGAIEGFTYEARFDSGGNLVQINGTRAEDGATASLAIDDATTTLDGSAVSISIPRAAGASVFSGTLSDDQNTITGSMTDEIDLGDLEATLPGGDLTLERVVETVDPCDDVTCADGETCVEGECVAADPCDGITCEAGESCVDGVCVIDDPCADVTCPEGESCVDGQCIADVAAGDPVAGEAFYAANGCAGCHLADGTGLVGPNIVGRDAATVLNVLTVAGAHVIGPNLPDTTQQDADDIEAFLATL